MYNCMIVTVMIVAGAMDHRVPPTADSVCVCVCVCTKTTQEFDTKQQKFNIKAEPQDSCLNHPSL